MFRHFVNFLKRRDVLKPDVFVIEQIEECIMILQVGKALRFEEIHDVAAWLD